MNKSVVLVHGHGPQPGAPALLDLWRATLAAGLQRDQSARVAAFEAVDLHLAYYADEYPTERAQAYDATLDLADLEQTHKTLAAFDKPRRFRRNFYDELPGKSSIQEFIADVSAPLARSVGLGKRTLAKRLPESGPYWSDDPTYAAGVQNRLLHILRPLLASDRSVFLIAHGFGSVIAYDTLWRLSHEHSDTNSARLHTLLTLGSPLADDSVRSQLLGRGASDVERYPDNLTFWHNVAAEDDAVCHDETVANDFGPMLRAHQLSAIEDHLIYNLAVRYGRSDPHCALGYLIHPKVTNLLSDWLES